MITYQESKRDVKDKKTHKCNFHTGKVSGQWTHRGRSPSLGWQGGTRGALHWAADGSGNIPAGNPPIIPVPGASAELLCFPHTRAEGTAICPWPAQGSLASPASSVWQRTASTAAGGKQEMVQQVIEHKNSLVLMKKNATATSVWLLFEASSALSGQ